MKIKKLLILFVLVLMLPLISGCSKDDSEDYRAKNIQALGSSARDLLSAEVYKSILIEIVYVKGYKPSEEALANLKSFLETRTFKPGGIHFIETEINSPEDPILSISEVINLEKKHRNFYTSEDNIAIFIFFVDGTSTNENDDNFVLGTAYRNTSIVIYEKNIQKLSHQSGYIPKTEIEITVLKHEFGHLFGLVNNGSPAQSSHEDPENKAHCNNQLCLMNSSVEFGKGAMKLIKGSQNFTFDENCLADLKANGGR